jgi:hypothetical protein
MRLSTFTRSRWIRLSSRSACRKKLSPPRISVLYFVVGGLLVRQHVAQRRVGGQVQAPDLQVDVLDGAELAGPVHVGLDVDRLQAVWEAAGLGVP